MKTHQPILLFTVYWLHGQRQVISGTDISQAFANAGIGGGAIRAVDFYANGADHAYEWKDKRWQKKSLSDLLQAARGIENASGELMLVLQDIELGGFEGAAEASHALNLALATSIKETES